MGSTVEGLNSFILFYFFFLTLRTSFLNKITAVCFQKVLLDKADSFKIIAVQALF